MKVSMSPILGNHVVNMTIKRLQNRKKDWDFAKKVMQVLGNKCKKPQSI